MSSEEKLFYNIKTGIGLTPIKDGPGSNKTGIIVERFFPPKTTSKSRMRKKVPASK